MGALTSRISDAGMAHRRCYVVLVRTTVRLDPEVAAAAEKLRRERHIGLGEAVNLLARAGLSSRVEPTPFHQRTANVGLAVDVHNVADVLELLDEDDTRARP